ncbi:reverse transcriptase domain-containing protein [Tanacetum coccineum]
MADTTMDELLRSSTHVQVNPFYGRESENPHAHINSFKRITSTLRFRNVSNDVIKLMMFPYSLEGAAKTWYEKEPPNSILTWEDLVTKFVNQFFPPSKTTHLKNEISRFTQKFEETFSEAWERFKELLRACPHHGFTELTQVDTFYNGLNENEQDSLNAAAGGNLLSKMTREALNIIENKSKVRYSRNRSNASRMNATSSKTDERIDKLADQLSTLVEIVSKKVVTPAPVKAVEETCVTCGELPFLYKIVGYDNNRLVLKRTDGEKLLELVKIPVERNCSAMLLKKLLKAWSGEPGKFLINNVLLPRYGANDNLFDLECKTNDWKRILYDAPIDEAECFDPGGDNDQIDAFLAIKVPTYIEEGYYDSEGDVLYLESLLNDDNTHNFSSDSDPLHYEFTGELITIPLGIVREHEDYINRMSLLCGNSSSRSLENFHTIIESLPSSTTLVEDSDSNREEIDIFSRPDDSIPPGIESDFDSEEDIIDNLLNDDPIPKYEHLTFNMEPDVHVINNVNEDECFDPGGGEINVEVDNSFTFVTRTFLPYLTYPEVSPLLSSTENEDTIFDPGIST